MTKLYKTYHCKQRNIDSVTIGSLDDPYLSGDLVVSVVEKEVSGYDDPAQVALSRADALSLAWDIIEHFEDGTRPKPVIKVGDYVKSVGGYVGRVLDIRDGFNGSFIDVQQPDGRHLWTYEYCSLATEQEFIDYHQQRIAAIANR